MLIFDAHLDLAWNALEWNRNLELSVDEIRQFEERFPDLVAGGCTVSYPELRRGNIGVVIATLLPRLRRKEKPLTFYQEREAGYGAAHGQLAYYRSMERKGILRSLPDASALSSHITDWQAYLSAPEGSRQPPIGYILSMEGAPPILEPAQVPEWYEAGLRIVGPAHYGANEYCHGTGSEGPLTPEGRELLKQMDSAGMLLDVTHLADESFWQALEVFQGPILASHHNCRALVPGDRQLDDEQIKALIERGAVIGAAFDNWMLIPGWKRGESDPSLVTLEKVADHIDHVCQLAGDAHHSGIGTDLDGGFGKEQSPSDLETIADLTKLAGILQRRGYADADIERIMWRNYVEFFQRAWK